MILSLRNVLQSIQHGYPAKEPHEIRQYHVPLFFRFELLKILAILQGKAEPSKYAAYSAWVVCVKIFSLYIAYYFSRSAKEGSRGDGGGGGGEEERGRFLGF